MAPMPMRAKRARVAGSEAAMPRAHAPHITLTLGTPADLILQSGLGISANGSHGANSKHAGANIAQALPILSSLSS